MLRFLLKRQCGTQPSEYHCAGGSGRILWAWDMRVVEGPEVEHDLYNFEKLNIPANHPAKG